MENKKLIMDQVHVSYGDSPVLRGVSMQIAPGKIIGIVGESGSGKSTSIYAALGILGRGGKVTSGNITYGEYDMLHLSKEQFRKLRGIELSLISQNPVESFHPIRKIRSELYELVKAHDAMSKKDAEATMIQSMEKLSLKDGKMILDKYAFELSGGMCQRTSIALAMVLKPQILFADEPTSALDVTVQKQVVEELLKIREDRGTAIAIVSHNMGVISYMSDEIYVMYAGLVVEHGNNVSVIHRAAHPYTQNLIHVVPRMNYPMPHGVRVAIQDRNSVGCPYASVCKRKSKQCEESIPEFTEIEKGHFVRCFHVI